MGYNYDLLTKFLIDNVKLKQKKEPRETGMWPWPFTNIFYSYEYLSQSCRLILFYLSSH